MTTQTIWQTAADLLRQEAQAIAESHAPRGDWGDDQAAKDDHDSMLATATELESWSNLLRLSNKRLQRDLDVLVDVASGLMIACVGTQHDTTRRDILANANNVLSCYANHLTDENGKAVYPLAGVASKAYMEGGRNDVESKLIDRMSLVKIIEERTRQRDELLALVVTAYESKANFGAGWSLRADEVIAKAKGGAA